MSPKKRIRSAIDVGGWAEHYVSQPFYGHYKDEVYPLFIDLLALLPDGMRVLDVGSGPGNLAMEYYRRRPRSTTRFILQDTSAEFLKIARARFSRRKDRVKTFLRDFNRRNWTSGMPKCDAVVSTNALFCVALRNLKRFYADCYAVLKNTAVILNLQSFAWQGTLSPYGNDRFARNVRALPAGILPEHPPVSRKVARELAARKKEATRHREAAIRKLEAQGCSVPEGMPYQFAETSSHLNAMRSAGFAAGCIWRKRQFAVLMGVKGDPFFRTGESG
ncbi:MAG: class I SAM-dependent methyltransferase [Planctomycetes bacterium]|nr:class I SAM-dependent methyltransferase [Planctomycetota bacterium]